MLLRKLVNYSVLNSRKFTTTNKKLNQISKDPAPPGKPDSNLIKELQNNPSPVIKVAGIDIDGIARGKYLEKEKYETAVKSGFGFCSVIFGWDSSDVTYDNVKFTGNHTGYPDILSRIDNSTYRTIPWESNIPFFLLDFYQNNGSILPICPRQILKHVISLCREHGYEPLMGMEFEWYNYLEDNHSLHDKDYRNPKPLSRGMFGYSNLRTSQYQAFNRSLWDLWKFGVPLEGLHTETGPGVFEAAIKFSDALEAADRAVLFKASTKEIAHQNNIMASFMAKPSQNLPGCSGHMHQNFTTLDRKKNLFLSEKEPNEMSDTFKHFLAGQLLLLPEFLPFYAPTVNSYKRLVDGYWAPTTPTWSYDNRTVAIRVIKAGKAMRSEFRVTGSDVNPYIAVAASFAAGLYGVLNKIPLKSEPIVGNSYDLYKKGLITRLPRTLNESTELLAKSKAARELLGDDFVDHFVSTRRWEYRQFNNYVHTWEIERYFENI